MFVYKYHTQIWRNMSDVLREKSSNHVLRNILVSVDRMLSNNDAPTIAFNSAEEMAKKMVQKHNF